MNPPKSISMEDRPSDAELLQRMHALRSHLGTEVQAAKQRVHQLADWRHHVKSAPWQSIGAAAVVGYLMVPKRIVKKQLDAEQLEKLTDRHPVIVTRQEGPHQSLLNTLLAVGGAALAKSASTYLANKLQQNVFRNEKPKAMSS